MEELKFSKTRPENRFNFLSQVCSNDFFVRAIVVDKRVIRSEYLITQPRTFYSYIINQVLTHASGTICDAKVKIDGSGSRKYKEAMQGYLRSQTGSSDFRVVRDVSFVNSKGNQLIQLADMIAGATRRSFDDSQSNSRDYAAALRKVWLQTKSDIWNFK